MPAPASRLAIDLSGGLLRVAYGALGGPIRCGSGGVPEGALVNGKVIDGPAISAALRQVLARAEIHESRAMLAVRDTVATFRVVDLPAATADGSIESVVTKLFPIDPDRIQVRWVDVRSDGRGRVVYATAWNRQLVKLAVDAVREAGVEAAVVDLKSACLARTVMEPACLLVDASTDVVEMVVIEDHVPRFWHEHELPSALTDDLVQMLVGPLRTVLTYHARHRSPGFGPRAPIYIASDRALAPSALSALGRELDRTVEMLPSPPRVPDIRYSTYLSCIGLLMRRS